MNLPTYGHRMSKAVNMFTWMFKKILRQVFILAFLLQGCVGLLATLAAANQFQGKLIKVTDGDTFTILHEGKELRIRLAEIDAPECGQFIWRKSRKALADYVVGKVI